MQTATLHIKVSPDFADSLKKIAYKRGESVGEIVRKSVISSYQAEMMSLPLRQKQALDAYCGAFISIGKLAEIMGMNILVLRKWLDEHEIRQNKTTFHRLSKQFFQQGKYDFVAMQEKNIYFGRKWQFCLQTSKLGRVGAFYRPRGNS